MSFRSFLATSYHFDNAFDYLAAAHEVLKLDYLIG